jgi:hypothetical protein
MNLLRSKNTLPYKDIKRQPNTNLLQEDEDKIKFTPVSLIEHHAMKIIKILKIYLLTSALN